MTAGASIAGKIVAFVLITVVVYFVVAFLLGSLSSKPRNTPSTNLVDSSEYETTATPSNASTSTASNTVNIDLRFNQVLCTDKQGNNSFGPASFVADSTISGHRIINPFASGEGGRSPLNKPTAEYVAHLANGWFVSVAPTQFPEIGKTYIHNRGKGKHVFQWTYIGSYVVTICDRDPAQTTRINRRAIQFDVDCQGQLTESQEQYSRPPRDRSEPLPRVICKFSGNTLVLKRCPRPYSTITILFTLDGTKSASCASVGLVRETIELSMPEGVLTISM